MNSYFVVISGRKDGPFSADEIASLIRDRKVTPDSLMWQKGLPNWVPLHAITDFGFQRPAPTLSSRSRHWKSAGARGLAVLFLLGALAWWKYHSFASPANDSVHSLAVVHDELRPAHPAKESPSSLPAIPLQSPPTPATPPPIVDTRYQDVVGYVYGATAKAPRKANQGPVDTFIQVRATITSVKPLRQDSNEVEVSFKYQIGSGLPQIFIGNGTAENFGQGTELNFVFLINHVRHDVHQDLNYLSIQSDNGKQVVLTRVP